MQPPEYGENGGGENFEEEAKEAEEQAVKDAKEAEFELEESMGSQDEDEDEEDPYGDDDDGKFGSIANDYIWSVDAVWEGALDVSDFSFDLSDHFTGITRRGEHDLKDRQTWRRCRFH